MPVPRILIADDHAIIRLGLKFILESHLNFSGVDEVEDCKGLFQSLNSNANTHLILDMQLSDCNSIDIFPLLRDQFPDLRILIYTMSPEEIFARRFLQMGASGFLSKQSDESEVQKALHLFLLGRKYISDKLEEEFRKESETGKEKRNPFDGLSEREMAVVNYLLQGKGVKEIANQLNLKSTTVATYKARVFDKMSINNLVDLKNIARIYQFAEW